ncbi:SMP-30/gluconolactonase/LRE family protein [Longimycelium tulufanense]|nr:SMP-30/gluconolactonase/LRE family protein [Longimycelium tulufanense]
MGDQGTLDVAVRTEAVLGVGPTWDSLYSSLLWVDALSSRVFRFTPGPDTNASLDMPQHVGAAKPRTVGGLVMNLRDGVALVDRDGSRRWLVYWAREGMRGTDAGVDPAGRLWASTSRYEKNDGRKSGKERKESAQQAQQLGGWLTQVEPDGSARVVVDGVGMGSGVAWSPDGRLLYYVDSPTRRVDVLVFDPTTGAAGRRRPLCEIEPEAGWPAGVCVDSDGCVWVALWDGWAVRRYTPEGRLDRELAVPVARPTACCFGGDDHSDLYVTTARAGLSPEVLAEQELAGSLLVITNVGNGLATPAFAG